MATKKGKKGKKKLPLPPEVKRYIQSQEYKYLQTLINLPGGIPSVHQQDTSQELQQSIATFLFAIGSIASSVKIGLPKEYRFLTHHRLQYPAPQYTPTGYPPEVIQHARTLLTHEYTVFIGGKRIRLQGGEDFLTKANQFLMDVDFYVSGLAACIREGLESNFGSTGLVAFQGDLREKIRTFDAAWVKFEKPLCGHIQEAMLEVYAPVDEIVDLEKKLSEAEIAHAYEEKRLMEQQLVKALNVRESDTKLLIFRGREFNRHKFMRERKTVTVEWVAAEKMSNFSFCKHRTFYILAATQAFRIYCTFLIKKNYYVANAVEEAEACVFYESKLSVGVVDEAKRFVKQYLKIAVYRASLAETSMGVNGILSIATTALAGE